MQPILDGLSVALSFNSLIFLFFGVVLGFVVGALPGFSSSNAAAIILPFTIAMSLDTALIFMSAIYAGAQFAGAVPAILINAPGTMGAAATALDGYPMTKQGKAALAIGIARMASVIGGVIGCVIVLLVITPMSRIALSFGPAEMFLVAVFGLTLISTVVGDNVKKGILSAGIGLLVAAMSADPYSGNARFNMGFLELYDKVPFVPILIGLFAVTEMFFLAKQNSINVENNLTEKRNSQLKDVIDGIKVTLKYPKDIGRSSLLGTLIGAIPGTGTAISNFVSYGIAKKAAKDNSKFGKGDPRGIIASESCDSAVTSGTMIPTLTLGIPGSTTAAIMLAALYLHGVQPGPQVMSNYSTEAYAVIVAIGIASILILPLGILLATPMIALTRLSPKVLVPFILFLCTVGAFSISNSMFDVGLMFVFGLLGIIMRINGYPVVPLVLALILGPIAESNFIKAYMISQGDFSYFFSTPITFLLWIIILGSLFGGPIKAFLRKRRL